MSWLKLGIAPAIVVGVIVAAAQSEQGPSKGSRERPIGETNMGVKQTRTVETELEIDAPVDAVWKALTDAKELTRWFPLEAKVKPGKGGAMWVSWGQPFEGESTIEIWEPGRRLRTGWPFTASPDGDPRPLVVDYFLEGRGGKTVLRLVHSGFGVGAKWDNEYEGVTRGWAFELRGLRHYLENHAGKDRRAIWVSKPTSLSPAEAIARVIGPEGRVVRGSIEGLKEGDPYRLELVGMNQHMEGVVDINMRPRSFAATVKNLNNAYFRCDMENCGGDEMVWVWFSTYGLDARAADKLQATIEANVTKALAE